MGLIGAIAIAVASFIINMINQMITNLEETNYEEETKKECFENNATLDKVATVFNIIKILAVIVLVLSVLFVFLIIVSIIVIAVVNFSILTKEIPVEGITKIIKNIFTSRFTYMIFLGSLSAIFICFMIGYAVVLGFLNTIKVDVSSVICFDGDEGDELSELGKLTQLKNTIITQMVVCLIMFVVCTAALIVLFIFTNKSPIASFKDKVVTPTKQMLKQMLKQKQEQEQEQKDVKLS
jgi:hypothetical protein